MDTRGNLTGADGDVGVWESRIRKVRSCFEPRALGGEAS